MKDDLTQIDAEFLGHMEPHKLRGPRFVGHIILFAIAAFLVIVLIWANFAVLDEVTQGVGKVIPSRQVQVVQNLEGGIVKKIMVKEGELVKKGQPLLIIDDTRYVSSYKGNLVKEVSLEIKYLRLQAEIEKKDFKVPQRLIKQDPETAKYELALYKERQQELKQLLISYQLVKKELNMTKPLVKKGAASPVEVLRLQRTISDLYAKVIKFRSTTLDELNKVKAELKPVKETNLANIDRIKRTIVRSPVKGIVKQLFIYTEGGVVQPGSDLVELVPLGDTLLVEAKIDPKDIGFLVPGQKATVTITAYDYSRYGSLEGKVEHISADAIIDEAKQETYYLVKVRTQKNYLGAKENPLYIIPGMQCQVNILTGKKSVLDYLINPFINTFNQALGEK